MSDAGTLTLVVAAVATGALHTLIPDHWLPFVLIGRARGWSLRTAAAVSGLSAAIHGVVAAVLALTVLAIGLGTADLIGERIERVSAGLLILFGVAYAAWSATKGGHFHPGGSLVHAEPEDEGCDGREGHLHPEHLHYHADDELIRGSSGWSATALALIVGANPCIVLLPIVLATAREGVATVALVTLAYVVPTAVLMVGLSVLGVASARRVRLPGAARHMETASGVLIALTGVVVWWLHGAG